MKIPTLRGEKDYIKNVTTTRAAVREMADCFLFKIYVKILQQSEKIVVNGKVVNFSKCSRLLQCVPKILSRTLKNMTPIFL
jgi:hypothetical protein